MTPEVFFNHTQSVHGYELLHNTGDVAVYKDGLDGRIIFCYRDECAMKYDKYLCELFEKVMRKLYGEKA
jgi:hypothetical protein